MPTIACAPTASASSTVAAVPVDEPDRAPVAALQRAARQLSAPFSGVARGAHDRDRAWGEEGIEASAHLPAGADPLQHANKHRTMSP